LDNPHAAGVYVRMTLDALE